MAACDLEIRPCACGRGLAGGDKILVARGMTNRLPPFKSIEAFVVAAESLSFTTTASSLHITVPAVGRGIQALEAELGVALFQRTHRSLELTQVGEDAFGVCGHDPQEERASG